ncbi:tetratricopeptide repeat protein [Thalassolituus sp.]|jgi:tetratricopeptide (TPR) repeat protein|uniref:tetratricopeptide repeat protein n=1 Tax=Thalassolituus sp. TaxID=2030822 RepID=UPI003513764C
MRTLFTDRSRVAIALLMSAVTMSGCSTLGGSKAAEETAPERPPVVTEYRSIPAPTMYSLLVAELAGQRQRYDISLFHYMDQARKTRDPNVAERALRIAQFVGASKFAAEASAIWLEVDPDDPGAVQAAAQVALTQHTFEDSLTLYTRFYEMTGVAQFDFFAVALTTQSPDDQSAALEQLTALSSDYPEEGNLYYARALLEQSLDQPDEAIRHINKALRLAPGLLPAAILKARILAATDRLPKAIDWLEDVLDDHPDNKQIALLRAKMLLQAERMEDARDAFALINHRFPEDPQIMLSLALLDSELGYYESAREILRNLIGMGAHENESHYYLAKIAADQGDNDLALLHYRQIGESREFLPGQLAASRLLRDEQGTDAALAYLEERVAQYPQYEADMLRLSTDLLIHDKRYEEATDALNRALDQAPDDVSLLYTRAMLSERMGDLQGLEDDLRKLLSIEPDHPEALNALGYSLANRTERFAEAEPLIEKALSLQPENPAIIDSLGWLYFREGKINEAGPLLMDAWSKMQDHEIAAHLGEWYWVTGAEDQAREVWKQGLELTPDSEVIMDTLQRHGLTPAEL